MLSFLSHLDEHWGFRVRLRLKLQKDIQDPGEILVRHQLLYSYREQGIGYTIHLVFLHKTLQIWLWQPKKLKTPDHTLNMKASLTVNEQPVQAIDRDHDSWARIQKSVWDPKPVSTSFIKNHENQYGVQNRSPPVFEQFSNPCSWERTDKTY
jgi:hypothetical protein